MSGNMQSMTNSTWLMSTCVTDSPSAGTGKSTVVCMFAAASDSTLLIHISGKRLVYTRQKHNRNKFGGS